MPFQDRFASRIVPIAALFSVAPLLLTAWAVWDVQRLLPEVRLEAQAVHGLIEEIDHLDHALTSTARLGAATGEPEFEARYDELDRELVAALDSLAGVAAALDQPGVAEAIGIVASRLAMLERNALRLAREGETERGYALLRSDAYLEAKGDYLEQREALLGGLMSWVAATEARVEDRLEAIVMMAGLSFLILLLVWGYSTYLVRRHLEQRRAAEAALRERVADQERLEEERRAAEERLRAIVDVAPIAIVRVDREHTVQYWNPAAERIFGWSADEVLGRPYPLEAPEQADDGGPGNLFDRAFAGERIEGMEIRRMRKDDSTAVLRMWNAVVQDGTGHPEGLVGVFADVTEQRTLEHRLRQSEKLEAIGRLAGGIAHDFNNVMTAVQGHTDLLLESLGERDPLRRDIEEIRTNAGRATALTGQLLAFSRRQVLKPRVLEPGAVVRGIEGMLRRLLGEGIRLEISEESGVGLIEADPTQIEQVIVNLAVNARDAMPEGGVLGIGVQNAALTQAEAKSFDYTVEPGPYVRLLVWDTGEGMDEATRQQVFEPFFTTKPTGRGTGLGMATVFGIVKQSGGYVWVRSAEGDGTEVEILLPRVQKALPEAGAPATPTAPAPDRRRGGETVLLVEDDDAVRSLTARVLHGRGYHVIPVESPASALTLLSAKDHPQLDLLITDMMLPGMNGHTLAERVLEKFPGIPVIFMSGYTEDEVLRKDVAAGVSIFLAKPFSPDELAGTVREVLDELTD